MAGRFPINHSQRDDPESQYPSTTNQFNPLHIHHVSNIPLYSRLPIFFFKYSFCINSSTFNDRILFLQIEPETTALCYLAFTISARHTIDFYLQLRCLWQCHIHVERQRFIKCISLDTNWTHMDRGGPPKIHKIITTAT